MSDDLMSNSTYLGTLYELVQAENDVAKSIQLVGKMVLISDKENRSAHNQLTEQLISVNNEISGNGKPGLKKNQENIKADIKIMQLEKEKEKERIKKIKDNWTKVWTGVAISVLITLIIYIGSRLMQNLDIFI